MKHLLLAVVSLLAFPATAYAFMFVVESESLIKGDAKIIFAPAFQGKTKVVLEPLSVPAAFSSGKYWITYPRNLETVTRQLETISAAGWELVEASPTATITTCFVKPKSRLN